jgi:hypothetical protein
MKSRLVFWFTAALLILAQFQDRRWKGLEVFDWDQGGYYSYLPATFLYGDPGRVDSLGQLVQQRWPAERNHSIASLGIHRLPNGRYATKYPLGVAVGELPWFGGAHVFARLHGDPPNGYSRPYQQAIMIAGLLYGLLGLWVLRKLLRRYYSDQVTAWTIAGIALGTNYFVYTSYEAALAHAVLFLWQASLLYCTSRWYEAPRRRWAAGIGLFLGLATLCRFTEALYVLIPLAWGLSSGAAWRQRPALWARHFDQLVLASGLGLAIVSAQFFFWHAVSGHWVLDGYQGEVFDFRHPHLLEGLFSIEKGWFLYTPLMAVTLVAGLLRLRRYVPAALPATLVLLPALLYLTFSWGQWGYGWTFSTRPLISVYPLLALSLAAMLAAVLRPGALSGVAVRALVVGCIVLNLWQTWQYVGGILQGEGYTAKLYKERFFWRNFPPAPPQPAK